MLEVLVQRIEKKLDLLIAGQDGLRSDMIAGQESLRSAMTAGQDSLRSAMTAGQESLRSSMITLAESVAELRGRMAYVPTTWQMLTAIIGGQIAFAGVIGAAVFGALRFTGHG